MNLNIKNYVPRPKKQKQNFFLNKILCTNVLKMKSRNKFQS